jgi:hypothetical protein
MPSRKTQPRLVRAFLAAPRDTSDEKAALLRAIESINRVTGREERFRIELIHWTTDTYPAVGPDAQSIVNMQIGDYDLLIVVFNREFGSRTPRANSGTEEEYDRALLRYLQDTRSVGILVYFADPLVRFHSVDPVALAQIKQFRRRLEKEGVLYAVYLDVAEFERLISVQLTSACRDFLSPKRLTQKPALGSSAMQEILRYPDWIAESRIVLPQSANYFEVDLSPYRRASLKFRGNIRSASSYFRFGFKLSGLRQPILGDGSIQTPDPNVVFHVGKNNGNGALFYTLYRNGRRFGTDHIFLDGLDATKEIAIGITISRDNVVGFQVNHEQVYEDHLATEARERLVILTWADEHQCKIEFTNISLEIDPGGK